MFGGRFSRRDELTGILIPSRKVEGEISPRVELEGRMESVPGLRGSLRGLCKFAGTGLRPLSVLYRFLESRRVMRTGKTAKPGTGPGVDLAVDSTLQAAKEAPLTAKPAQDMAVNQRERLTVSALLVAYRRAGCMYLKRLFFHRRAAATTAPGTAAQFRKAQPVAHAAKAAAADSSVMESRGNTVDTGHKAAGAAAHGATVPGVSLAMPAKHTAQAGKVAAVGLKFNVLSNVQHSAILRADKAISGTCGTNATWTLKDGLLTISGEGSMKSYYSTASIPWYEYKDDIAEVIIEEGITSIGYMAFNGCSALLAVTLPKTLKTIGGQSFVGTAITEITIPDSVTEIGGYAFSTSSTASKLKTLNVTGKWGGYSGSSLKVSKGALTVSRLNTYPYNQYTYKRV